MSIALRRNAATAPSSLGSSSSTDNLLDSPSSSNSSGSKGKNKQQSPQHIKQAPQSSASENNIPNNNASSTINNNNAMIKTNKSKSSSSGYLTPRTRSVLFMSLSLAIHLGGYELSRATVMALFTSDGLGFGHSHHKIDNNNNDNNNNEGGGVSSSSEDGGLSALPMAVGCVSPFSFALLWFYAKTLSGGGPQYALRTHTLICAGTQIVSGWLLGAFDAYLKMDETQASLVNWPESKVKVWSNILLFFLFVFQNAYVQLLYNQHWAFISSILTPEEGKRAFAPIAGLGSIGSTLAAGLVSVFVDRLGLIGLLHMAGVSYIASAILADMAFGVAIAGGFEPGSAAGDTTNKKFDEVGSGSKDNNGEQQRISNGASMTASSSSSTASTKGAYAPLKASSDSTTSSSSSPSSTTKTTSSKSINNKYTSSCCKKGNIFQQAHALFQRVPVLGALFMEVIVSQCLSSLVNFIYLYKLKSTITDDAMRAGWAGNFYAWINGVSGIFQFFVIPLLLRHVEAHRIWLCMPTIMLCCTIFTIATFRSSGLLGASASFFAIKTMEYSLRGAANEMLYVSLDYESRYLGKKVISLIAGKFGKSAMAVVLSLVMVMYGDHADTMWYLLATATVFTFLWLFTSMSLHTLIDASK